MQGIHYFRSMPALLTVSQVYKKENETQAIAGISFTQQHSEKIAVAGETGSGKTTLLKMIGGFVQKDAGDILFESKPIIGPFDQLIPGHPGIAYLSQHFELRNNYWVHEILEYANKLTASEANELYKICRIDNLLNRRTNQLSGGEKQRIALARILIGKPKLLLLDEPYSNLDAIHKNIIKTVINDIGERLHISCIMISHDAPDILSWADKILILKDGRLEQEGTPEEIYFRPMNEYCAGLFGPYNLLCMDFLPAGSSGNNNKKIFARPEQLQIVPESAEAIRGIVKRQLFNGNYYITEVLAADRLLLVQSGDNRREPGEAVYVAGKSDKFWHL